MKRTKKIEFMGHILTVQTTDNEISLVLMDINGIHIPIGKLLHPEYLEEIKNKLI